MAPKPHYRSTSSVSASPSALAPQHNGVTIAIDSRGMHAHAQTSGTVKVRKTMFGWHHDVTA